MPCRTDGYPEHTSSHHIELRSYMQETYGGNQQDYIDTDESSMETSLCAWCKRNPEKIRLLSKAFRTWWKAHQEADRRHEQEDIMKASIKSKLTKEEVQWLHANRWLFDLR